MHEKTVLDTLQLNDVAEQMKQTIMEKVQCILKMAKLLKSF